MKRHFKTAISSLMATALVITSLTTMPKVSKAATQTVEVDGITYEYVSVEDYAENVIITSTGISGNINIPEKLDGYSVKSIGSPDKQFVTNSQFATKNKNVTVTIENVEEVYENAFEDVTRLKELTLPEGLQTIGNSAFSNTGLTKLTLPESLQTIGDSAFSNTKLTELTLPESLQTIGDSAFSNTKLTELTLPESLQTIGDSAFAGNADLDIQFLNPNTIFTGFTKWNVNGIEGFENSTVKDFTELSGDKFVTLNDYNETDSYTSSIMTLNKGEVVKEVKDEETGEIKEVKEDTNIKIDFNEKFPALSTKVYLKNNYKVPNLLNLPTCEHYTFKGYAIKDVLFYNENGEPIAENIDEVNEAFGKDYFKVEDDEVYTTNEALSDLSLTAVWEADTYTVEFDSNAEYAYYDIPLGEMETQTLTYNKFGTLSKNLFSQAGYDFKSWNTRRSGAGSSYEDEEEVINIISGDWKNGDTVKLYVQWSPKTFHVSYKYPEKAEVNEDAVKSASYVFSPSKDAADITIPTEGAISLKGNTFKGWVDENGEIVDTIYRNIPKDTILTASFEPNVYTLYVDGKEVTKFTYNDKESIIFPELSIPEGYTLVRYAGDENVKETNRVWSIAPGTATDVFVTTELAENIYKIYYDLKGGTAHGELITERKYTAAVPTLPAVTKEGYTFEGWVDKDGSIVESIPAKFDGDIELTAKFSKIKNIPEQPTDSPENSENPNSSKEPDTTPSGTTEPTQVSSAPANTPTPSAVPSVQPTTPSVTKTPSTPTVASKITVNIKNKKTYKKSKKVVIKATKGIKTVKLNSKKLPAKKGAKKYSFKIKKFKKYLKKKGWNKLVITDKKNKKKTIKFKVKK